MKTNFSEQELVELLRSRQGVKTQAEFALDLGISDKLLSNIYGGKRSVGNKNVLRYLAPPGYTFERQKFFVLTTAKRRKSAPSAKHPAT